MWVINVFECNSTEESQERRKKEFSSGCDAPEATLLSKSVSCSIGSRWLWENQATGVLSRGPRLF